MTIGTKILLGFFVITLLVLVVGATSLSASQQIIESFEGGEEHFRSIVSAATEVSSYAKRDESHLILYIGLHDCVDRDKFFDIKTSLLEQIDILDQSVQVPEAKIILNNIKSGKDELIVTSQSLLEVHDENHTNIEHFKAEEHAELIRRFHQAASNIRKYGVELAEFETDFLNKQAAITSATEVSSWVKRAEGHLMLYLMLHEETDREKFFLRHASLLEQINILDKRVTDPKARVTLDEIKSKADELLNAGTSLLDEYDEDIEITGVFDLEKHQQEILNFYYFSSAIREGGVELAKFSVALEAEAEETAIQNALNTRNNMLVIMISAILVAFVLAYFISRTISKPIKELKAVAVEVGKGDFSRKAQVKTKDEIGELANSFNQMTDELCQRNNQLEVTNETLRKIQSELEIRVQERTSELAEANEGLLNEIAERKQVEIEREKLLNRLQDKTNELEQIIYIASHDLRSPLVNIQGFTKELENSVEQMREITNNGDIPPAVKEKLAIYMQEDIPEALNFVLAGTAKIDSLLSGLLRLSRLGRATIDIQNINMNEMLKDISRTLEFILKNSKTKLEVADLPHCQGDKVQINQVFSNLIDNAIKYRDPERPAFIKVTGKTQDRQAIFCVEDNGIGIAEEHQQKIFKIFQRIGVPKSTGEGLGLSIVRRILDRHSGKVWLESEPGKGSKFFISLPAGSDTKKGGRRYADPENSNTLS